MKAIVYNEYGPPDVLHVEEVEKPTPKDDQILIKVHASNIGYGDLLARNMKAVTPRTFNMPSPLLLPTRFFFGFRKPRIRILGSELAGEVEAVGKEVTRFKVGDQVYAYRGMGMGANAEYLCMPEKGMVAIKPSNMSFEEAATVPYGAFVALQLLRRMNIQPGQKVLVNGASGGIGVYAVQIAKHYGAEVTGVCSTPRMEYVKALGADHVIDYTQEDFTQGDETYDLIFDVLGRSSFARCKRVLTENGRCLFASFRMKHVFQMLWTRLSSKKRLICGMAGEKPEDLDTIRELVEAGEIIAIIDQRFPLEEAAEAHRYIEAGHKKGQVVLTVA